MKRIHKLLALALLVAPLSSWGALATPSAPTAATSGGPNATTVTSGSFTPTGSSLLVALAYYRDPTGGITFDGFSDSGSWCTWSTSVNNDTEYGTDNVSTMIGYCLVSSSPSAGTVAIDFSGSEIPDRARLFLIEIDSGFDLTTPIRQVKTTGTASTVSSLTDDFSSAPLSGSVLLSIVGGSGSFERSVTEDTGWTEIEEQTSSLMHTDTQYRTGTTSTQYGGSWSGTNAAGTSIAAVEVQEPVSSGSVIPVLLQQLHRGYGPQRSQQLGGLMQ